MELGLGAGALGGGHADHVQAFSDPRGKQFDKMRRRRAGPKPEPHPRGNELQGFSGGEPFGVVRGKLWHEAAAMAPARCAWVTRLRAAASTQSRRLAPARRAHIYI